MKEKNKNRELKIVETNETTDYKCLKIIYFTHQASQQGVWQLPCTTQRAPPAAPHQKQEKKLINLVSLTQISSKIAWFDLIITFSSALTISRWSEMLFPNASRALPSKR